MNRTPWIVLAVACVRGPGDIIDADPRARVERLKTDVAADPTTSQTLPDRLDFLWRWANEYALSGGALSLRVYRP